MTTPAPDPYARRLPPNWTAEQIREDLYLIRNQDGVVIAEQKIDNQIPISTHIRYIWYRYGFE